MNNFYLGADASGCVRSLMYTHLLYTPYLLILSHICPHLSEL
jgi:hypothetical protein